MFGKIICAWTFYFVSGSIVIIGKIVYNRKDWRMKKLENNIGYESELRYICTRMQKSYGEKFNSISQLETLNCINKIMKLNRRTKNEKIDELMYALGRAKLEYTKYCNEHNYYADSYLVNKFKDSYMKLSRKSMKLKTKKKKILADGIKMDIEYNSDRGSYVINNFKNGKLVSSKEYNIADIRNLDKKRKYIANKLKKMNFGIDVFEELDVSKDKFYKVNPDIINILLSENKIDYAKMYIKEVIDCETMNTPLQIKYVLNRDLKKGRFSPEENQNMKKMAQKDWSASDLIIVGDKSQKKIIKPVQNPFTKIAQVFNFGSINQPRYNGMNLFKLSEVDSSFRTSRSKEKELTSFKKKIQVDNSYINSRFNNHSYFNKGISNNSKTPNGSFRNTRTGKIVASMVK